MSKDEYIVVISEGEIAEKHIIGNIKKLFFNRGQNIVFLPFKTDIFELYRVMEEDDFETDIIEVLIERDENIKKVFEKYDKSHISEIYLFFDYDGHSYKRSNVDEKVEKMIQVFKNETEHGKIYISYPMVESIKDIKIKDKCSRRCVVTAKENIRYKKLVSGDTDFQDLRNFTTTDWTLIILHNIKKANCIITSSYLCTNYDNYRKIINQEMIFTNQIHKYISPNDQIAVLSAFPFFLIDYFGEDLYNSIIGQDDNQEIKCLYN